MCDSVTPADLSRELTVTQKRIHDYLRQRYGTLPSHEPRWQLDDEQAADARNHFLGS